MATLSLLHGLELLICFQGALVLAVDDRQSPNPGSTSVRSTLELMVAHMKNYSLLSSRHVSLYLRNALKLANRPVIAGRWSLVHLLPFLIPCTIWAIQWRNRERRQRSSDEISGEVSDTIGVGGHKILSSQTFADHVPDALSTDPGLLKKHSVYGWYQVSATGFTYPSLRIFYRPHPQRDKLPTEPSAIPLLVFIHGLGGSTAQFHPLLTSLVNCADSLAIDLPGCGLSRFDPKDWKAYTTEALVYLLATVIERHRDKDHNQKIVFVCHSMGCSLGAYLASSTSPYSVLLSEHVCGMVAICPIAEPPNARQASLGRRVLSVLPVTVFDLWRMYDRRGGVDSKSIIRFTGEDADLETRKLQLRFNEQSRSAVWMRMAYGCLPDYSTGLPVGGIPGRAVWSGLKIPLFLVAGEADHITSPRNVYKIAAFLGKEPSPPDEHKFKEKADHESSVISVIKAEIQELEELGPDAITAPSTLEVPQDSVSVSSFEENADEDPSTMTASLLIKGPPAFKTCIFPAPASHALLYSSRTARPLSGFIQNFLSTHIDYRLSLGWQLQHLTTEGKWDVKNLHKWRAVQRVSLPIAGVFRAMKTLREVDERHSPRIFVHEWGPQGGSADNQGNGKDGLGAITAVVDISHESPVYDPQELEKGGIHYHKFPTVSKLPPTLDEVKHFIDVIDQLRAEFHVKATDPKPHLLIGVHCHYGFNRTGFFIVCYLVERLDWRLKDAITEFKEKRPPGIRHAHFIDELWRRYWTREMGKRED